MRVRLKLKTKTDIIFTYAPPAKGGQRDTPSDVKDEYYTELSKMIAETQKHNKIIVMGDMNVKVRNPQKPKGEDSYRQSWSHRQKANRRHGPGDRSIIYRQ